MRTLKITALIIISLIVVSSCGEGDKPSSSTSTQTPKPAPDFTLPDLDGNNINLKDYRGKVVLIVFWATWCPPCRAKIPHLNELYKEYQEKNFALLTINVKEDPARVKRFAQEKGIKYTVLSDREGKVTRQYNVVGLPTVVLVDKDGKIRFFGVGTPIKKIKEELLQFIL